MSQASSSRHLPVIFSNNSSVSVDNLLDLPKATRKENLGCAFDGEEVAVVREVVGRRNGSRERVRWCSWVELGELEHEFGLQGQVIRRAYSRSQ